MNIPRYWAKVDLSARNFKGKQVPFSCWRWSDHSIETAKALAREAGKRIKLRIEGAAAALERYAYGSRPLREEIIEEFRGRDGQVSAVISRNAFGCLILNTARVMFVDIDLPRQNRWGSLRTRLTAWFGGGKRLLAEKETAAISRIEDWVRINPTWGFRVYRTRAGFRLLATHALVDPDLPSAEVVMNALGCDPLYLKLCHAQQSFRARLTPKPWRAGHKRPSTRYPREREGDEASFRHWLDTYQAACQGFSTCTFVKAVGAARVHPDVEPMIRIHDQHTRIASGLPLA